MKPLGSGVSKVDWTTIFDFVAQIFEGARPMAKDNRLLGRIALFSGSNRFWGLATFPLGGLRRLRFFRS